MISNTLDRAPGVAGFANRLATVGRGVARMLRALRHRRQVNELVHFDDRMLADLGITRMDLHQALAGPLLEDPSKLLAREREAARRKMPSIF